MAGPVSVESGRVGPGGAVEETRDNCIGEGFGASVLKGVGVLDGVIFGVTLRLGRCSNLLVIGVFGGSLVPWEAAF